MDKRTKIILGIVYPLAVFSGYWFIVRNREPSLNVDNVDWLNNLVNIKFGNNKKTISVGNNGEMNAGATYSDKYKLQFKSDKNIMTFYIKDKNGDIIDKKTLDFGAKISY
jgi:hypothetical protein